MQDSTKFLEDLSRFDILLFDRFSNHCLANALEPFRAANTLLRTEAYAWRFLTLDGGPATSSSGLTVAPEMALASALGGQEKPDALFVISGYGHRALDRPEVAAALRRAAARARLVIGFDTGAWLLAAAGLLDGRRATLHWDLLGAFDERFPRIETARARYVLDGPRITCSGAMAAFDLALALLKARFGEALRLDVAANFMHGPGFSGAAPPAASPETLGAGPVARAVTLMQETVDEPLPLAEIARRLGRSQRDLERRFQREFGATPLAIYRRIRLAAARRWVETSDLTIAEIAARSGYENASAMTRAFKRAFGAPPTALRR
ncbi:MAG: helix-turn-helix domain-containing protein [Pseudomonadota bacterium]